MIFIAVLSAYSPRAVCTRT